MVDWYFSKTSEKIWLGTSPNIRAEQLFYIESLAEKRLGNMEKMK